MEYNEISSEMPAKVTKLTVVKKAVKPSQGAEKPTEADLRKPYETVAEPPKLERVAAYYRVSTLADEQELSYESQREYYRAVIENSPHMELVDVYGDDGFSGLHAKTRPEFMRMISDAQAGKLDEVMVKSISRFSRNMIDCQKYLNILKDCGVRVYFEKENIYSNDPQCELVMKLLSAVAQEESNSLSQNVRWAYQRNNENGNPTRICPYGYVKAPRTTDKRHVWLIDETKAKRIRYLFKLAQRETNLNKLAKRMQEYEQKNGTTANWCRANVWFRLRNEAYKGDILTSKTCIPDFLTGHTVDNKGYYQQLYLKDHHPAIVDRKVFDKVQAALRKGTNA